MSEDAQIGAYVRKLEQQYDDAGLLAPENMPQPEDVVKELEEFLKEQQRRNGKGGNTS